jgi:hypothetical protein
VPKALKLKFNGGDSASNDPTLSCVGKSCKNEKYRIKDCLDLKGLVKAGYCLLCDNSEVIYNT